MSEDAGIEHGSILYCGFGFDSQKHFQTTRLDLIHDQLYFFVMPFQKLKTNRIPMHTCLTRECISVNQNFYLLLFIIIIYLI